MSDAGVVTARRRQQGPGGVGATLSSARAAPDWAAALVLLLALAYYGVFIGKTTFRIGAVRYCTLFDDAMVSMRYARNLARGYGLVWNPGEPPVEGFTNPLWTLLMAPVHWLPVPPAQISLAIQLLGALILVGLLVSLRALCLRLARGVQTEVNRSRLGRDTSRGALPVSRAWPLISMVLVAFYYPLVYWTLEGMEVGLLALVLVAGAARLTRGTLPAAYALLALGTLVRTDFAVPLVALAAGAAWLDPTRRTRHVLMGVGATLIPVAAQTAARIVYFHDPLPNTYYLKMTGYPLLLRLARGGWVFLQWLFSSWSVVVLPALTLLFATPVWRRRMIAALAPALALGAYSVWVGGDAWEGVIACNRYLAVGLPLLLMVAAWSLALFAAAVDPRGRLAAILPAALAAAAVLTLSPYRYTLLLDSPPYVRENAELVARGLAARGLTRPEGRVAAAAVGAIGYYSDRRIVDLLGKNDRRIARLPMRRTSAGNELTWFYPGHLKWDYAYSIGGLRPDVVAQLWWAPREAESALRAYDVVDAQIDGRMLRMAVRRGSPAVEWGE